MAKKKTSGKKPAKQSDLSRSAKPKPKKSPTKKPASKPAKKKQAPKKPARKAKVFDPEVKTPPVKRARKPKARPLSKRELPVKYHGLASTLKDLEKNSDKINKLKRPGEKWAFEIDGIRSWATFNHIDHFAQYLQESAGVRHLFRRHKQAKEFWRALKLIRWNGTASEWKPSAQKLSSKQLKKRNREAAKQAKRRRK